MDELVKYIVSELVEDPSQVEVTMAEESETVMIINVRLPKDEMGKVIGKCGKVAEAIRRIVRASTYKLGKKYIVKIGEKE